VYTAAGTSWLPHPTEGPVHSWNRTMHHRSFIILSAGYPRHHHHRRTLVRSILIYSMIFSV
jgi:hypothetical protein